jgi:hypothetical protein
MKQKNRPSRDSTDIRIRNARESDLPELIALYEQLHLGDYSYRAPSIREMTTAFRAIARDRGHRLLVATLGNQLVGTLHVMIFFDTSVTVCDPSRLSKTSWCSTRCDRGELASD